MALKILYEVDTVQHPPSEVLERYLEDNPDISAENELFLRQMVEGVLAYKEPMDDLIEQCAPEWPVDQLAVLDRNILRMALWELAAYQETPLKVAINEAVELAKRFGSDSSPRFINGVLGTLADREHELRRALAPSG